ncbi:hypothetical protein OA92_00325 [Marinomonas sp. SBI22]|nr:hypothetical protein TW85_19025 [Marinomonas sp. S3726]KZM45697.1 hypothetical protein OA92_00325 [Marinomonas sp. SBI22]KZM46216.1 hypothetical protein OA91_04470 [Marinomonas sp. SBI8L]
MPCLTFAQFVFKGSLESKKQKPSPRNNLKAIQNKVIANRKPSAAALLQFKYNYLNATKKRRERRLGEAKSKRKSGAYRDK